MHRRVCGGATAWLSVGIDVPGAVSHKKQRGCGLHIAETPCETRTAASDDLGCLGSFPWIFAIWSWCCGTKGEVAEPFCFGHSQGTYLAWEFVCGGGELVSTDSVSTLFEERVRIALYVLSTVTKYIWHERDAVYV